MPLDVNLIQRGEIQSRLVRGLGIRERSPAPHLAGEISPVVLVEDLSRISPLNPPSDHRPCIVAQATTPAAGQFITLQLRNPTGSGVVLSVMNVIWASTTNDQIRAGFLSGVLSTAGPSPAFRDRRLSTALPATRTFSQSFAAAGNTGGEFLLDMFCLASTPYSYSLGGILVPENASVAIESMSANAGLRVSWLWDEWATVL